jgi:hypothetical protein
MDGLSGRLGAPQIVVVVEDVHWADSATLDCLTYLARAAGVDALTLVVTCRSDEVPLDAQVARWLARVRGGRVEEIRLGPLSRGEAVQQIAGLVGEEPPDRFADDLFERAEGKPVFHRAARRRVAGRLDGDLLHPPGLLPERLAELLMVRASGCGTAPRLCWQGSRSPGGRY